MFNKQSQNTIKGVVAVLLVLILGEGILGWGIYWPFLLMLLEWSGVYWLALIVGIAISVWRGVFVGLPSLFILGVVGVLSLGFNLRKVNMWLVVAISVIANICFDRLFGFDWSLLELVGVVICSFIAVRWFERGESLKLNY